jgi:hypothetical protein
MPQQSSREVEIVGPVDAATLIVPAGSDAKRDRRSIFNQGDRD